MIKDSKAIAIAGPGALPLIGRAIRLYLEVSKARLSALVVATTGVGFVLGSRGDLDPLRLGWTVFGTALTALGANCWNEWLEREADARMKRTRTRPLPSRRMRPETACLVGGLSVFWGLLILLTFTNALTAGLALLVELLYLAVYTPLKRRSPTCTLVGALCGAIPPIMGWTAATGVIEPGAWLLASLLFLWQMPHFLALAWLYRDDYERGGFRMLPLVDRRGTVTSLAAVLYSLALLPLGLIAALIGLAGWTTTVGSLLLGGWMLALAIALERDRSDRNARRLFMASLAYLPLFLSLLLLDRGPAAVNAHLTKPVAESVESAFLP